jgi:thiosulfate/3-mercaptopyruvate sulfurtransferase
MSTAVPVILQAEALQRLLGQPDVIVVDLSGEAAYERQHIPGAVNVDATLLGSSRPPVMGLLPAEDVLSRLLSGAGITPSSHVVAYDSENGLKASRFLWTLDVIGHERFSLLDGGLAAWLDAGFAVDDEIPRPADSDYPVRYGDSRTTDKDYIRSHLDDAGVVVLDARTPAEYRGMDRRALRAGHIPGAVNVDWSLALCGGGDLRLRPADELRALYAGAGVTPDREVIVHCHTHQRSSHTYLVLKSLGYPRVKGYPGSWSDWGNDPDMPIE